VYGVILKTDVRLLATLLTEN